MTLIRVEVAYAKPGIQVLLSLEIPEDFAAIAAIHASGVLDRFPEIDLGSISIGIFGRPCGLDQRLLPGNRIEIYRPLIADPRTARRERVQKK